MASKRVVNKFKILISELSRIAEFRLIEIIRKQNLYEDYGTVLIRSNLIENTEVRGIYKWMAGEPTYEMAIDLANDFYFLKKISNDKTNPFFNEIEKMNTIIIERFLMFLNYLYVSSKKEPLDIYLSIEFFKLLKYNRLAKVLANDLYVIKKNNNKYLWVAGRPSKDMAIDVYSKCISNIGEHEKMMIRLSVLEELDSEPVCFSLLDSGVGPYLFGMRELAEFLKVSVTTARKIRKETHIATYKRGRAFMFIKSEVLDALKIK